jgi:N12 class adenine-specific DNA methylase
VFHTKERKVEKKEKVEKEKIKLNFQLLSMNDIIIKVLYKKKPSDREWNVFYKKVGLIWIHFVIDFVECSEINDVQFEIAVHRETSPNVLHIQYSS